MSKKKMSLQKWAGWTLKLFWAAVAIVVVASLTQYVSTRTASFAAETGGTAVASTPLTFSQYFCDEITGPAGNVIVALAIFMILAAGVVYMLSLGQAGSDKSVGGINTAKSMIVAALTGLALYLMSAFLLGNCVSSGGLGGWIGSFFH